MLSTQTSTVDTLTSIAVFRLISNKTIMQKSQERLDIFVDYLESAEWIQPVQSFIDYYCVVFYSQDRN